MILRVRPCPALKGSIVLPASKSYSIRAHLIAACGGESRIIGGSNCEDAAVARRLGQALRQNSHCFDVGESGTSLRFLLPLLPLHTSCATIQGHGTLLGRPNHHLCQTLRAQGLDIRGRGQKESVPIVYRGGALRPGTIKIKGSLSSQFISALLIAAPRLEGDSRIVVTGKEMVSCDYIVMTRQILAMAGIKLEAHSSKFKAPKEFIVPGNQKFKGLRNFHVPSDYGLAAFPMAAAVLIPSQVLLKGHFNDRLSQADGHILEFLRRLGGKFRKSGQGITIQGPFQLKGGTFSLKNCPDLVPIMSVLALFAKGKTRLVDIKHARAKESDRISDLRRELLKIGARITESCASLTIIPQAQYKNDQLLDPHNDHRLAMAFTVLGLKLGCQIKRIECVGKSYPDFVKDMKILGMH